VSGPTAAEATAPRRTPTNQQALLALYMLQDAARVKASSGTVPGAQWIEGHGVIVGITNVSRKAAIRLIRASTCLNCAEPLSPESTGDHLLALANGGPAGLENYVPLCGRCNSSKGTRDFLDWWIERRGRSARELPPDVLATYCRLQFAQCVRLGTLGKDASTSLGGAITDLGDVLPTVELKRALWLRVVRLTGKSW